MVIFYVQVIVRSFLPDMACIWSWIDPEGTHSLGGVKAGGTWEHRALHLCLVVLAGDAQL